MRADSERCGNLRAEVCVSESAAWLSLILGICVIRVIGGNLRARASRSLICAACACRWCAGPGAGESHLFGEDIFVAAGQQVHNATCLFCSVQVEGDVTGRVFVLFGSLNVSGQV